jgi:tRNA A-37 threonylcarbamoyl transferase component Bud32
MNDINMSTTSSTEASPSDAHKPEQTLENELLSASYKIFNKNFTTLMKYTNSSSTLDINMAIDSTSASPSTTTNNNSDLFSPGDVEAKKQLDDLLAAASLSTPGPIPSTSGLKRQVNNLHLAELDAPKQFVNPVELSVHKRVSRSSSSSCSSASKSSSAKSSSSSSSSSNETTLVHNASDLERFNSNTNKHALLMSKPATPLPSQSGSKLSAPLMANSKAKASIHSEPEQAKASTSAAAAAAKPAAFNIENELIKYTKSLKLSTQSYLSSYKLGAHIRNGGFSEIYEGATQAKSESVIIKLIPKHKTKNWLMVHNKKYPAEVLLHKMCNSVSGVVRMVEFFEQEHEWIIIMSKLSNCMDLFDYLESKQRGRLSENEACHFFRQLVRINMDLFHQGVCHRDLKSENLLVDLDTLNLVLIDFGASAIYRNASQHFYTDFHGTRQYKPPEYIKNKK